MFTQCMRVMFDQLGHQFAELRMVSEENLAGQMKRTLQQTQCHLRTDLRLNEEEEEERQEEEVERITNSFDG